MFVISLCSLHSKVHWNSICYSFFKFLSLLQPFVVYRTICTSCIPVRPWVVHRLSLTPFYVRRLSYVLLRNYGIQYNFWFFFQILSLLTLSRVLIHLAPKLAITKLYQTTIVLGSSQSLGLFLQLGSC